MRFYLGLRSWSAILFVIVLIMGLSAIFGFYRLQIAIDDILRSHYQAVLAGQKMNRVLDVHGRDILRLTARGRRAADAPTGDIADTQVDEFESALYGASSAAGRGGSETLARLEGEWRTYREVLQRTPGNERDKHWFLNELLPAYWQLREAIRAFIFSNQEGMQKSRDTARLTARYWSYSMAALTFIGLVGTLLFNYQINQVVIRPVRRFARFIDRVNLGETHLRVPRQQEDYLNSLALSSNRLIENFEKITEGDRRAIQVERQRSTALIEAFDGAAVLVNDAVEIVLANAAARLMFTGENGNEAANALKEAVQENAPQMTIEKRPVKLEIRDGVNVKGFAGRLVLLHPAGGNKRRGGNAADA